MTVSERIPFSGLLPLQKGYTYVFASFNSIMVGVLMVAIAVYVCVGLPNMNPGQLVLADMFSSGPKLTTLGAGIAVLSSSLSGGTSISQIADDVKNPRCNIPPRHPARPSGRGRDLYPNGRRHARRDARGTADDALRGGQGLPAPGATFGVLMTLFSFANCLGDIVLCIIPFFLRKKYPHACRHAGFTMPLWALYAMSVFAIVVAAYLSYSALLTLGATVWLLLAIFAVVFVAYVLLRIAYLKRQGRDLMAELKAPYAPFEERKAEYAAMDAGK